ncbi:uncharacterized protein LOC142336224 isoform X2 [Convolutriloba macropyga]|uniref:uncharacterized protein LOC142336224 isoform X2 n=1 Tax=Convolutriloba macropyga TaxID=536237 RepID=UPI003F52233F
MNGQLVSLNIPQCSVCSKPFHDPLFLPCGHMFCSGPKECLNKLKKVEGNHAVIKCALCNVSHRVKVEELKNVHELKEVLNVTKCEKHSSRPVILWCKCCSVKLCDLCCDDHEDSHSLMSYRKYLQNSVRQKLDSGVIEMSEIREKKLRSVLDQTTKSLLSNNLNIGDIDKLRRFAEGSNRNISERIVRDFLDFRVVRADNQIANISIQDSDFFSEDHFLLLSWLNKAESATLDVKFPDVLAWKCSGIMRESDIVELKCGYMLYMGACRNKQNALALYLLCENCEPNVEVPIIVIFQFIIKNEERPKDEELEMLVCKFVNCKEASSYGYVNTIKWPDLINKDNGWLDSEDNLTVCGKMLILYSNKSD